ncbi:GPW/gp25 family protein [Leeuwenhoekiella sp. H156]|uniref:GPW/gp25 family protein n=1 Tax=Leeuwenhoekiella sp. H156 TaxID=3450128 RepID=UPI003FA445CF
MKDNLAFLGTGWAFPPHFDKESGKTQMTSGVEDINASLHILLSTKLGERVMLPKYGCAMQDLVFESLDLSTRTYIEERIRTAILYHEKRIDLLGVSYDRSRELEGEVRLLIEYNIRQTNARGNMVYPFYKEEGFNN